MKNLKRVFSMMLALVMLIGMMAVPSAAADFADADEIVNNERAREVYLGESFRI